VWGVISPGIDPVSKSKIRMLGGKEKYLPEMEKCGIPRSSVPRELGGEHVSTSFWDALKEFVEEEERTGSSSTLVAVDGTVPAVIHAS